MDETAKIILVCVIMGFLAIVAVLIFRFLLEKAVLMSFARQHLFSSSVEGERSTIQWIDIFRGFRIILFWLYIGILMIFIVLSIVCFVGYLGYVFEQSRNIAPQDEIQEFVLL